MVLVRTVYAAAAPSAMASYAHVCGLCGRPFAILIPPGAEDTERDKLCAECVKLPPPPKPDTC